MHTYSATNDINYQQIWICLVTCSSDAFVYDVQFLCKCLVNTLDLVCSGLEGMAGGTSDSDSLTCSL